MKCKKGFRFIEINCLWLLLVEFLAYVHASSSSSSSSTEANSHIELGNKLLAAGQLADALTHYHQAIDADTSNYMSYFRRGTVYLAMGKSKAALQDLNKVVELKPDFVSARLQRANVLFKQGLFDDAKLDYQQIIKSDSKNADALDKLEKLYTVEEDVQNSRLLMRRGDFFGAIELLNKVLEQCPWSIESHQLRSECHTSVGDIQRAANDIHALSKLIPDNTDAYLKLSELHYELGDADQALNNIRECLKLDQEHKKCSDLYKKLKKLAKFIDNMKKSHDESRFDDCIHSAQLIIELVGTTSNKFISQSNSFTCACNSKAKYTQKAIDSCTKVLRENENDLDALHNRAQAYITEEKYDEALHDCSKGKNIENSERFNECTAKIQRLLKQSKKRDYYKILGVKRSASKKEIIKAYRKQAQEWHPDQHPEGPEKERAQRMFIDIAAAKEVLTDADKRAKFDAGEDPLDAEEQANSGHHGFHGGFNPFGQGGFNPFGGNNGNFQFKFKFN